MKEFKVSNEDLVIYVKEVRDELHDTNRNLLIIHRFGDNECQDIYRLVEPRCIFGVINTYLS